MANSDRDQVLRKWLDSLFPRTGYSLAPASEDASFRSYLRLTTAEQSYIVMDAPPAQEDCAPFIDVAGRLERAGLCVPAVHSTCLEEGFLLLSDLGQTCYFDVLDTPASPDNYADAIDAIVHMQSRTQVAGLPDYSRTRLEQELRLFPDWFLRQHLELSLTADEDAALSIEFDALCAVCLEQPQVFVHRDYHCRNLMVGDRAANPSTNPGIIDFQDAVRGPLTYDLVSLCLDVYVDWPQQQIALWMERFRTRALAAGLCDDLSAARLRRWFNFTAAQRLLKIAGIFARLYHRDGKSRYLADIPRTLGHLSRVCRAEPGLSRLGRILASMRLASAVAAANERWL